VSQLNRGAFDFDAEKRQQRGERIEGASVE
jgi:hypothetical protein